MDTKEQDKLIKDAQYRKGLSIAFFNATNASIEMCKGMNINEEATKAKIVEIRNWLLGEHAAYYATVISNIGANFKAEDSIAKLKATANMEELRLAWRLLSEDERQHEDIIKVAKDLKAHYEETSG